MQIKYTDCITCVYNILNSALIYLWIIQNPFQRQRIGKIRIVQLPLWRHNSSSFVVGGRWGPGESTIENQFDCEVTVSSSLTLSLISLRFALNATTRFLFLLFNFKNLTRTSQGSKVIFNSFKTLIFSHFVLNTFFYFHCG